MPRRARQEEVEPRIALDITQTFTRAGAVVLPARTLGDAHQLVEQNSLSAAVLDFRGGDGDADALWAKLIAQNIPFGIHSGYPHTLRNSGTAFPKGVPPCREPRRLIDGAAYDADTQAVLRMVFDEVWASVAPDFGDDPEEIEDARIRLATIVLALAKD